LTRQRSILEQCFAALRGDGVFLEFSYGPLSPIPGRLVKELALAPRRLQRVCGNFPPATIWEYRRTGTDYSPDIPLLTTCPTHDDQLHTCAKRRTSQ
jgi:phosphatidylethanolamine/phosphatidyl-N-methylethanolamine N-methyltransferase